MLSGSIRLTPDPLTLLTGTDQDNSGATPLRIKVPAGLG